MSEPEKLGETEAFKDWTRRWLQAAIMAIDTMEENPVPTVAEALGEQTESTENE